MSRGYIRFAWITLVLIFLVIIAGSVVRSAGAGMGCPDWPKCFDQIIPPTSADQLPVDYKEKYAEYRKVKIFKFASLLDVIGMNSEAESLRTNPELLKEEDFNATKTWTEYGNRLVGFLAGNAVLILLIWTLIRYRSNRTLVFLTFLNLVLMGFEGWLGSVVVSTNLVPWIITLHMLFALLIVVVQIYIIRRCQTSTVVRQISPVFRWLFYFSILLTFVQVILGAQVRQEVDFMVKEGVERALWIDSMQGDFLFHRSFSWILLGANVILFWLNQKANYGFSSLKYILGILIGLFVTGILFSYAGMPAFVQPMHLLFACVLFALQLFSLSYLKRGQVEMNH
jgi:cytochrome c oxidase assembly protein subunit 15